MRENVKIHAFQEISLNQGFDCCDLIKSILKENHGERISPEALGARLQKQRRGCNEAGVG